MVRTRLASMAVVSALAGGVNAEATLLDWSDLNGWASDNHLDALNVFKVTCGDLREGDWPAICALADQTDNARIFFESFFRPVLVTDEEDPLFTGYYEPELVGSRVRSDEFNVPLHRLPDDIPRGGRWLSRAQLAESGVLQGRGLELVWLRNEMDKFFLQIQGSGRIRLSEGGLMRVGYGGKNGHPYRSIGRELVRRGEFEEHQVSAQVIRNWIDRNPDQSADLLNHNPSYVFFREVSQVDPSQGPLGAMNRSVTAGRSIAVDPDYVPLGSPVWIEKAGAAPIRRLMIAQDTGAAIKGAQRADIFYGTGEEAGLEAGRIRDGGRMVLLLPIQDALALVDTDL